MKIIYTFRVWKAWRDSNNNYGQFLGNVGCEIASGRLPSDVMETINFDKIAKYFVS